RTLLVRDARPGPSRTHVPWRQPGRNGAVSSTPSWRSRRKAKVLSPILLLGLDQGALLALSLACVWPETVSGVAAIGGYLPEIPGWVPDDLPLHGMPVLLVHDPEYPEVSPALQQKTEETLIAKGAQVTVRSVARARQLHPPLAYLLNEWMEIVRSR